MSIELIFSGQLYACRTSHHMTQRKMAELCRVPLRHYQDWEIGRALPNFKNAVFVAATLDLSLDELKNEVMD